MNTKSLFLSATLSALLTVLLNITHHTRAHNYTYDPSTTVIITVPVADMLIHPSSYYGITRPSHLYSMLPLSCEPVGFACVRTHQCLFGELLYNAQRVNNQYVGYIPNTWFGFNNMRHMPYTRYYTLASNGIFLSELSNNKKIIDALVGNNTKQKNVLTLMVPWHHEKTQRTFSAGTRFVRIPEHDTDQTYAVSVIDFTNKTTHDAKIPKKVCLINKHLNNKHKQKQLFVNILKLWAHRSSGIIPYVLGGSSFVEEYPDTPAQLLESPDNNQTNIYVRELPDKTSNKKTVYSGFDCSELIWRAANIADIRCPYKNTAMLARFLKRLKHKQNLEEGDLIWVPQHVLIVSDIKNNKVIEAAGYKWGYGKVHEISLAKRFENISTFDQLLQAYYDHHKITLLPITDDYAKKEYSECKILKFL